MNLCNETITVYNTRHNMDLDRDEYIATVISGVSWYCEIVSAVNDGLKAANRFTIRIPADADFGGKTYVDPREYEQADNVDGLFTLRSGNIVVHGTVTDENPRQKELQHNYESFTILGVTDNRRAPNAPHWKVVGS